MSAGSAAVLRRQPAALACVRRAEIIQDLLLGGGGTPQHSETRRNVNATSINTAPPRKRPRKKKLHVELSTEDVNPLHPHPATAAAALTAAPFSYIHSAREDAPSRTAETVTLTRTMAYCLLFVPERVRVRVRLRAVGWLRRTKFKFKFFNTWSNMCISSFHVITYIHVHISKVMNCFAP